MTNGVINIAKGRVIEYYNRVKSNDPANSALIIVLLKAVEADDALLDHNTLDALIAAASNTEADFTNYGRKVLTDADLAALPSPDDTNNRFEVDIPDQTWVAAGGATNNTLVKLLVCFDPDTTGGDDTTIIPLTHHDFAVTTDGSDLIAQINASGFFRAA